MPAGLFNCWALFKDCELYVRAVQTGRSIPIQEFTADLKHRREVFGETLSRWTPTCTTTNWPLIILGLPSLFLEMSCHAKSVAWTNREIFPGIYNVSNSITVYWCWASLDGPIVTNSLFSQTCLSSFPQCVAWTVTSFSHGEGGDVKHTFMGGLGSYLQSTWKLVPWFVGQSVCWPLYHGIFTLICQNMLCASNVSRLHLHAHTLKVEAAAWLEDGSRVCDQFMVKINLFRTRCMLFYFAKTIKFVSWGNTFPFCFHLFLRTFQQPNPFCCNRSTTNLFMISFLSRTIDFFFFFLSLWIYLWLAETSQQPISQTTWLKFTPHCNHCNHCNHSWVFVSR